MAFLQHHPRRSGRVQQLSNSPSESTTLSLSAQSDRETGNEVKDWSILFPGRTKSNAAVASALEKTGSPFVSSPDEQAAADDESNVELALPNEQDGTGRFTRPSSPFYVADDEEDDLEEIGVETFDHTVPRLVGPPTVDSISEDESEFEGLDELSSSVFLSGSERGRRGSSVSHGQRRPSEWERGVDGSSSSAASWAWMNAESSLRSNHRGRARTGQSQSTLPVVFTSGSEGEEEEKVDKKTRHRLGEEEEAAFEDALANTHSALSAGLRSRVPKRRHRKNGESAKGSKRSNSSAVVASDLRGSRRRAAAYTTRRSAASNYSARDASRVRGTEKAKTEVVNDQQKDSRTQRLLDVVLRKLFRVDDEEVLQAFLRDEGPLQVEETRSNNSRIIDASTSLGVRSCDEVWIRNERNRKMRQSRDAEKDEAQDDDDEDQPHELVRLPSRGMDSSQMLPPPIRIRLASHVGEPSFLEALQASVYSGLTVVPSGLSILLAGSRSVQLARYLAGQIGPSLTERVRKLIDDAEDDDSSITEDIFGGESSPSMTRFRGGSHPAISSHSSTTFNSRARDDSHSSVATS